jgi:alkylhydroperoxidase family enzyme
MVVMHRRLRHRGWLFRLRVVFDGTPIVLVHEGTQPGLRKEAEGPVPEEDRKRAAHRALVDRVLNGEGRASAEQRARAFGNDGLSPPLDALIGKVADRPAQVTEEDLAAAMASGCTEDQVFELVVCAAVGKSTRQYEAGLAALAEATTEGRTDHAT